MSQENIEVLTSELRSKHLNTSVVPGRFFVIN
jgi:hypothetical protein